MYYKLSLKFETKKNVLLYIKTIKQIVLFTQFACWTGIVDKSQQPDTDRPTGTPNYFIINEKKINNYKLIN